MEYTSKRSKVYRIGLRLIGLFFSGGAGAYIYYAVTRGSVGPLRMITIAIAMVFLLVGLTYVKQSLGLTAYDVTYKVLPEYLEVTSRKKTIEISYDSITTLNLKKVQENMDYYMLHIISGKYNFVMHIEGEGELANQMYQQLLKYTDASGENSEE